MPHHVYIDAVIAVFAFSTRSVVLRAACVKVLKTLALRCRKRLLRFSCFKLPTDSFQHNKLEFVFETVEELFEGSIFGPIGNNKGSLRSLVKS